MPVDDVAYCEHSGVPAHLEKLVHAYQPAVCQRILEEWSEDLGIWYRAISVDLSRTGDTSESVARSKRACTNDKVGIGETRALACGHTVHFPGRVLDGVVEDDIDTKRAQAALNVLAEFVGIS